MNNRALVLVVVFVQCFHSGLSIDCHQCASWDSDGCADPYVEDNMDGCDDRDTHCLKIKTVNRLYDSGFILGEPRVSVVASRGCIRADGEGDYCEGTEIASGIMIRCLCSTDGCNTAHSLVPSVFSILIVTLMTLLLWKRP